MNTDLPVRAKRLLLELEIEAVTYWNILQLIIPLQHLSITGFTLDKIGHLARFSKDLFFKEYLIGFADNLSRERLLFDIQRERLRNKIDILFCLDFVEIEFNFNQYL